MHFRITVVRSALCVCIAVAVPAHAGLWGGLRGTSGDAGESPAGECRPEVGFSPEGTAAALVGRALDSARHSVRLAAYSFTSPDVVRRLVAAKRRGVDVAVVVDQKNNVNQDRSGKARAALNLLVNAGIPTRTVSVYAIHHDKYIVVDNATVQTGSFNFSAAAATRNSENALVLWNCPAMAKPYVDHWQSRWERGTAWRSIY